MDVTTLERANALNRKIKTLSEALNCFEYKDDNGKVYSTDPALVIDYEGGDGRESLAIPMYLNEKLIHVIKSNVVEELRQAVTEFNSL